MANRHGFVLSVVVSFSLLAGKVLALFLRCDVVVQGARLLGLKKYDVKTL